MLKQLSDDEYFALESISKSDLDLIHKAPALFKHRKETPMRETPALKFGRAFHCQVLEPRVFETDYIITDFHTASKAYKELAKKSGKNIIQSSDMSKIQMMHHSLQKNDLFQYMLSKVSDKEIACIVQDEHGNHRRSKFDLLADIDGKACIIDLKTTMDASPETFCKSAYNYRYHVQAAYYVDNLWLHEAGKLPCENDVQFWLAVVEKDAPHLSTMYKVPWETIEKGRDEYIKDLIVYNQCLAQDDWRGLESQYELQLPTWAKA